MECTASEWHTRRLSFGSFRVCLSVTVEQRIQRAAWGATLGSRDDKRVRQKAWLQKQSDRLLPVQQALVNVAVSLRRAEHSGSPHG